MDRLLVALTPSQDLFTCAKDLFLEAKLLGLDQCAAMERPAVRPSATRGRAFAASVLPKDRDARLRGIKLTSQMGVAAASVLMSHQALQRDHGIVTQLLGCHQQHLPHRACGPLGTAHRWIGGFAPPHPRNAEGSCHSRGSTTAGNFRTEQVLLREMGNARTKS